MLSICRSTWNNSAPTGWIFMKFNHCVFFFNFKFHVYVAGITGTLHDEQYLFLITSRSFLLRMKNVSDRSCRENQTHIFCSITYYTENCAIYEIMWKNTVDPNRHWRTIGCMIFACQIHKATDTHSEYVILNAVPVKQCLHEYTSVSHYVYVAHLVSI